LNHAGGDLASNYDDLSYLIVPNAAQVGTVILQLARYNDVFLDESFQNGSDGNLYEFNFIGSSTGTTDGNKESPKLTSNPQALAIDLKDLGDSKENYRWHLPLKNNRDEDDYSKLMAVAKAFSLTGTAFIDAITPLIDVDEWLRNAAMATLIGGGDNWLSGPSAEGYNAAFYVRPKDGKVLIFPWDWD